MCLPILRNCLSDFIDTFKYEILSEKFNAFSSEGIVEVFSKFGSVLNRGDTNG